MCVAIISFDSVCIQSGFFAVFPENTCGVFCLRQLCLVDASACCSTCFCVSLMEKVCRPPHMKCDELITWESCDPAADSQADLEGSGTIGDSGPFPLPVDAVMAAVHVPFHSYSAFAQISRSRQYPIFSGCNRIPTPRH